MIENENIYGKHALKKAVGLVVLAIALQISGAGAATQINSCTTISSPGEYMLTQDIINSTSDACIKITSSSVVLDGAGHTIDGVDSFTSAVPGYGVYVNNPAETPISVTVKNLKVTDWDSGIFYEGAADSLILSAGLLPVAGAIVLLAGAALTTFNKIKR